MADVEVKVTYRYVDNPSETNPFTVDMEAHIDLGAERVFIAGPCLCRGFHKLYWTLLGDPEAVLSDFELTKRPEQVEIGWPPVFDPSARKWTIFIDNTAAGAFGEITYNFRCNGRPMNFPYDPTIVVTEDPPPRGILA